MVSEADSLFQDLKTLSDEHIEIYETVPGQLWKIGKKKKKIGKKNKQKQANKQTNKQNKTKQNKTKQNKTKQRYFG
jgi:hypothetical protein